MNNINLKYILIIMYIYNQELIKILVFDFEFIFLNYIYFREIIRIIYFFQ